MLLRDFCVTLGPAVNTGNSLLASVAKHRTNRQRRLAVLVGRKTFFSGLSVAILVRRETFFSGSGPPVHVLLDSFRSRISRASRVIIPSVAVISLKSHHAQKSKNEEYKVTHCFSPCSNMSSELLKNDYIYYSIQTNFMQML